MYNWLFILKLDPLIIYDEFRRKEEFFNKVNDPIHEEVSEQDFYF
jgi:hypothetical protein